MTQQRSFTQQQLADDGLKDLLLFTNQVMDLLLLQEKGHKRFQGMSPSQIITLAVDICSSNLPSDRRKALVQSGLHLIQKIGTVNDVKEYQRKIGDAESKLELLQS